MRRLRMHPIASAAQADASRLRAGLMDRAEDAREGVSSRDLAGPSGSALFPSESVRRVASSAARAGGGGPPHRAPSRGPAPTIPGPIACVPPRCSRSGRLCLRIPLLTRRPPQVRHAFREALHDYSATSLLFPHALRLSSL